MYTSAHTPLKTEKKIVKAFCSNLSFLLNNLCDAESISTEEKFSIMAEFGQDIEFGIGTISFTPVLLSQTQ